MQRPPASTTRRPVVLLVQQSPDDGDMYAAFLRYCGLAPIAVSNARDARVLAPHADIIVTGIMLDGPTDGIALVRRLRADACTKHTPIIVLTTCVWPRDRQRAERAGCDVFLPKPCLPNDLLREVRLLLSATRARQGRRFTRGIKAACTVERSAGERAMACNIEMHRGF